ncbi:MAG: XRE family transcriptional regulator [Comamonas sp.]
MNRLVSIGDRLREERVRLGLTQPAIGEIGGVTKKTQMLYEGGERAPDANYLSAIAAHGADVRYVLTGARDYAPPPPLSGEEQLMLQYYRDAVPAVRKAALGALMGAPALTQIGGSNSQHSSGDGAMMIGSINNGKKRK